MIKTQEERRKKKVVNILISVVAGGLVLAILALAFYLILIWFPVSMFTLVGLFLLAVVSKSIYDIFLYDDWQKPPYLR